VAAAVLTQSTIPVADSTDVALAASGDRLAFERLYRAHVGKVFTLCTRMCGNRTRGEELTQDVFVRTWEKLPQFRGDSAFGTWLYRIAVNIVLTDRKTAGRHRARLKEEDDESPVDVFAPAASVPRDAERLDLAAAIETLPAGARQIFVLHDVEGYKHEEIAKMCGITSGGSKAQLHRARMLLREALTR